MPCYDPRDDLGTRDMERGRLHKENPKLTAMLCALSRVVDKWLPEVAVRGYWDTKKAGVSYDEYRKWLEEHRREDAVREKKEYTLKGYLK